MNAIHFRKDRSVAWMKRSGVQVFLTIIALVFVLASCTEAPEPPNRGTDQATAETGSQVEGSNAPGSLDAATIAENNRGVGLMGQFDYAAARDYFDYNIAGSKWSNGPAYLTHRVKDGGG